jgi:hypothetical protein
MLYTFLVSFISHFFKNSVLAVVIEILKARNICCGLFSVVGCFKRLLHPQLLYMCICSSALYVVVFSIFELRCHQSNLKAGLLLQILE